MTLDPDEAAPSGVVLDMAIAAEAIPRSARLSFRRALMSVSDELWPDLRWEAVGELPARGKSPRALGPLATATSTLSGGLKPIAHPLEANMPRAA